MTTFQALSVVIYLAISIWRLTKADEEEDDTLMSVFFANTGLGRWWREPEYLTLADAQIDSLLMSDYDTLCLTELNVDKLTTRYANALSDKYPYQYIPPRITTQSQCNCTTEQYETAYSCVNATLASGSNDYSDCWQGAPPTNQTTTSVSCSNCWSAYFDETEGLTSMEICDGGDYDQTRETRPPPTDGSCVYGDGQLNVALFSKYPMSNQGYKAFETQSLMYNGIVNAEFIKNDINYHVFCTGFANWRHFDVMQGQAMEVEEYMNDVINIDTELSGGDTIVILGGDFNTGPKDECVECVDYPEIDGNLTVYNTILDINPELIYSIYLENFEEDGSMIPRCTSCKDNLRNDDDPDYIEYIGMNIFGFVGDNEGSSEKYIAKRGWVTDYIDSLNTSLSDKYAVVIMESETTIAIETTDDDIDGVIARIGVVNYIFALLGVVFVCIFAC